MVTSIQNAQELSGSLPGRFGLFSVPLNICKPKDALRALLDARSLVDSIAQETPRWPTECQVLREKIRHVQYIPEVPEPFYVPTGKEPKPKPVGDELGTIVYRYSPTSVTNYFSRSCVGGNSVIPMDRILGRSEPTGRDPDDVMLIAESPGLNEPNTSDLCFESRFESGNLGKVVKITDTYYQLHLRRDLYTQRHTQWYYFRVSNTRSKVIYRFSIVNLCKEESLYNEGLRPLLYSTEDAKTRSVGWRRCGENITYYRNTDSPNEEDKEKHTLTFNITFPYDRDTVYLAHCYPYTYSDLQEYLSKIVSDPVKTRFTKLRLLCRTLAGNGVYYLTITAPTYEEDARRKRGIVITARVHPGETPSSWTMKGIIDFLTGESNQARELRERFVFKLVPMLNPDGVIVGNNRCSLSGKDLNRQFRTVMRESYPSVWHTKLMIRRLLEECGVAIYCDLHAHSRKHNIFAYGCENKRTGAASTRLSEQVFPLMLHKNAADKFSFENCKFHIEKGKEGTGRVVVCSMGVPNSYTIEASMGGSLIGSRSGTHFSTQDYEQIGRTFCETLLDYFDQDPMKERLRCKIVMRLLKEGSSAEEPTNIDLTDYSSDEGSTKSSVSDDEGRYEEDWENEELANDSICHPYLIVPPPSPTSNSPRNVQKTRKKLRKGKEIGRSYLTQRKLLSKRPVMDLPTTDPGSDLCDFTDSGDEGFYGSRKAELDDEDANANASGKPEESERGLEYNADNLTLPAIVRPRSLSFGENVVEQREYHRASRRLHCLRLTRTLRKETAAIARDTSPRTKLASFRQQIWTGVSVDNENSDDEDDPFLGMPLSWGISRMVSTNYQVDSEMLLRSCSEKLREWNHVLQKYNTKKTKRKSRRRKVECVIPEAEQIIKHESEEQKVSKKKRSRGKWQRTVTINSRAKESYSAKGSFLTVKADSLKLLDTTSKSLPKTDSRKKFYKGAVIVTTVNGINTNKSKLKMENMMKLRALMEPLCDTTSSEDSCNESKSKTVRKKQKKKKPLKKIKTAANKKTFSAKTLREA